VTLRIDTSRADGSETNLWFDNIVGAIGESFNSTADLQVVGDFTLTADSTLELVVESTDSFSEVLVDGQFTADGTFQFSELPGAVFSGGDVYDVFDFGSVTGAFDNIVLPTLAGSLNWDTSNLLVTGELLVVSARGLDGDYNEDGVVNAADYVVWRNNEGTANELPNDPLGGTIGQAQYDQWATNFGIGLGSGANANSTQVPEPTSLLLLLAGVCGATRWRTSR
jgi:hypothetical protein